MQWTQFDRGERKPLNQRVIILALLVVGALIVAALGWVAIQAYGGISALTDLLSLSPEGISLEVQAPERVRLGTEFKLSVRVTNERQEFLTIDEILLPDALLDVVEVISLFPGSVQQGNRSRAVGYRVDYLLAPGSSVEFVFTMRAVRLGEVSQDVRVGIGLSRARAKAELQIAEAGADGDGGAPDAATIVPQSVVRVTSLYLRGGVLTEAWSASGTLVSADGLVLTSARAVLADKYFPVDGLLVSISDQAGQPAVPAFYAEVIQADRLLDLAVLQPIRNMNNQAIDRAALDLPFVELGDSGFLKGGDPLAFMGYPGGSEVPLARLQGMVTDVSDPIGFGQNALIHTSETLPGAFRGGLAADGSGSLVGIPTVGGNPSLSAPADCPVLVDTNRDGQIDGLDTCVPTAYLLSDLRAVALAIPLIEAAKRGEVNVIEPKEIPIPVPQGSVTIYSEDFSDPRSGWSSFANSDGQIGYKNTEYQILLKQKGRILTGRSGNSFESAIITVRARVVTPSGDGEYGVLCRIQDEANYYAMSLSEDGFASIWKVQGGKLTPLLSWFRSPAIPRYDPARIAASCVGNRLTLAVNGKVIAQASDDSFSSGDIGLFAGTWKNDFFTIVFDELTVAAP